MKRTPISISIRRDDLKIIERIASTNELSRSEVIGTAVHEYIERYQGFNELEDLARRMELAEKEISVIRSVIGKVKE